MANKNQSLRFKLGIAKWRIWAEETIQSLIDSIGKINEDVEQIQGDIEQLQIDTEKFEISTSVFEKDLAKDATYDWGADLTIDEKDDVYFISLNPEVATVNQNGVVKMLVDDTNPAFAEILVVGKTNTERLLVFVEGLSGFKFNFGGGDFMALFDETCHLVKPNSDIVALTTEVAEACPAGVCHLIYEKANTYINLDGMPIIGELKTLFSGELHCVGCSSLTTLSAPMATYLGCYGCTSLTTLSAPMATELHCYGCTSLTTLSAPMAIYLYCGGCALTATSIASILADAVLLPDLSNINFDFVGGTNAAIGTWSAQAVADKDAIVGDGGVVLFNS